MEIRNFKQDLKASQTKEVDARVRQKIPVIFASQKLYIKDIIKNEVDGNDGGIDFTVLITDGQSFNIDIKNRTKWNFHRFEDICLEIYSNVQTEKVGWSLDKTKKTDYVLWIYADFTYLCNFKKLVTVFSKNLETWKVNYHSGINKQDTDNLYNSQTIFIPFSVLRAELNKLN